ncbi:MAG: AAA family ATPase, partial [Planctomycetota bacterium]
MRFERLVLRRYGAFQERTLDFAPGARLHVVHGPNGAGKSTTLAALRSALFGITAKEGAFRYAPATRRLEVALVRGDGERIEFQRRSSPTQPLWSADDAEPLDAAALVPFLGGLDRATYTRLFGLDQEELRTGGEDLVEQRAELGQALFSAALGAERLAEVRDALGGELAALHTPGSRSKARVAELTREHADLKRRRRDAEFSQGALKKARKEIRELEARADALDGERREHERRAERLTSLAAAARDLARLDDLVEKRSAFGEEPALAEGVASEVRVLFDELKRSDVEATEGRRAELERKRELGDARAARAEAGDGEAPGGDPEADRRMLAQLGRALVQAAGRREEAERALERARAAHARAVETHAAAPARAAEEFAADFDALSPFRGGLESLRAVRVPSESAFEQLSVRESSAESAAESAARSLEEAEEKERAALSRTERARAAVGGDVPSAEAVSDARDARDRALESALSAEPSRPERVLEVARLVAEADGLIDERLAAGAGEAELRLAEREEAQARAACGRARAEAAARTDEREVVRAD